MSSHKVSIPLARQDRVAVTIMVSIAGSTFLAILSQLAIPLPFTPVPMTLQTLAIFLLGAFLGSRRATYSVLLYLGQASMGFPVLAGGLANPLWFIGAKAGFLFSFIAAAFLIGKLMEKGPNTKLYYIIFSFIVGQIAISGIGMAWLSYYVGMYKAFLIGVLPFLSGAAVKMAAATLTVKGWQRMYVTTDSD